MSNQLNMATPKAPETSKGVDKFTSEDTLIATGKMKVAVVEPTR